MKFQAKYVFIVWLLAALTLLGWNGARKLVTFDHDSRLYHQSLLENFEQMSVRELVSVSGASGKTLLHFQSEGCLCGMIAGSHISSVKKLATEHGFINKTINIDDSSSTLIKFIPALPAVAMLDENNELVYLGPYSTGMYCAQGNGIVEPFIQGQRLKAKGPVIPYDAEGCYCENQSKSA